MPSVVLTAGFQGESTRPVASSTAASLSRVAIGVVKLLPGTGPS